MLGWMSYKLESRQAGETLMIESKEELKSLLMRVKESERAGIKLYIKNYIKYQIFKKHLSIKKILRSA